MNILVPPWFYGFDSLMYFLSSILGFLLSIYLYKIHSLSLGKGHEYLYFGFLLLSLGFLVLTASSVYSYVNFEICNTGCSLGMFDRTFSVEDFAYMMYFGFSLLAYIMFIFAYEHEGIKFSKIFALLFVGYLILISVLLAMQRNYKIWYSYSEYFHFTSLFMLVFVMFRSFVNFDAKRDVSSFLVVSAFGFISLYHLLYLFSSISGWLYIAAHASVLMGFFTFLVMIAKVRNK